MKDTMNGKNADALARRLRPQDYVEGRGLSPAGEKVAALLHAADDVATLEVRPEADDAWQLVHLD